ncbi:uncharacterized protein PITG_04420 [Phytophthora infestans T30-4]|uniref:Secreted RxLR effector peptide protein n=1 Tax=Phytophthora infestans (strain T30-4) TaxID=403677 RepID=D0N180_PHYIT|nr:uncharacterized protein PITG_04420 [Phytophthora infestans T30-4]EEY67393.1 hypothetical protein PITG_04420 [Phytophthora infestans T30-4]|eukprot:XP_002906041.1 hypothetical protein PITG_04420 [Phytophthora infestans T30-4]
MLAGAAFSSALVFGAFITRAEAHGYLEQPKPSWKDDSQSYGLDKMIWPIQMVEVVGGRRFYVMVDNYWDIGSGGDQVGKFKTMAKEKSMSSVGYGQGTEMRKHPGKRRRAARSIRRNSQVAGQWWWWLHPHWAL